MTPPQESLREKSQSQVDGRASAAARGGTRRRASVGEAAPEDRSVSMVYLYYDNPHMLAVQLACWNEYIGTLDPPPTVLLIDDGSPYTQAVEVVRHHGCKLPIQVFRIFEDIPWNFAGARNLGCRHAQGWIYISDIDTVLEAEEAQRLFEGRSLRPDRFYMPRRVWLPDFTEASPAIVNLLFHRTRYDQINGYDEDYAGHYGKEETDFHERLKTVATKTYRKDVIIQAVPPALVGDARTVTSRSRNKKRNDELYACKRAAGFVTPTRALRFTWERVL